MIYLRSKIYDAQTLLESETLNKQERLIYCIFYLLFEFSYRNMRINFYILIYSLKTKERKKQINFTKDNKCKKYCTRTNCGPKLFDVLTEVVKDVPH